MRAIAVAQLRSAGCTTVEADSGPAAMEVLQKTPTVEILLTDMVTPGGAGCSWRAKRCACGRASASCSSPDSHRIGPIPRTSAQECSVQEGL